MSTSAAAVKPKKPTAVRIPYDIIIHSSNRDAVLELVLPKIFGKKSYTLTPETRWIETLLRMLHTCPKYMQESYFQRLTDYVAHSSNYNRCLVVYKVLPKPDDFAAARRWMQREMKKRGL
jgi:hypothetical protein